MVTKILPLISQSGYSTITGAKMSGKSDCDYSEW